MKKVFSSRLDLTDQPIDHLGIECFMMAAALSGMAHFAGYAVVTPDTVIEAHLLLVRTSAQKAELIALICTLQLTTEVWVNICMDSKYAFPTINVHGALYKERGLINFGGKC
jgi:ribonuclease HI